MGSLLNKVYTWLVKQPIRTGSLAALSTMPYAVYTLYTFVTKGKHMSKINPESVLYMVKIMSPMLVLPIAGIATDLLQTFTYEDKYHPMTRLSDFKKRKLLKKAVSSGDFEIT
jgi:hypothetical protein